MNARRLLLLVVVCLALSTVMAAELAGVTLPDSVTVDGKTLVLNGIGLREKLMFDVYVAGLYLEQSSQDDKAILASDQAKQLRMHFVYKKVGKSKLAEAWTEGLEANAADAAKLTAGLEKLNGCMEDVVRNDTMTFTSTPGGGLRVEVKGVDKGTIDDPAFARAFWSIFLGPNPPTSALKNGLLGRG